VATWIAHLRIAENLLNTFQIAERTKFIVGNIGPDCGVPNEDWSEFTPSGEVSHWRNNSDKEIEYSAFYDQHCKNPVSDFYLGYYVHLLTDDLWGELVYKKKREKYRAEFQKDPGFIWTMKKDWYDLDKVYLNEHRLESFEIFRNIKSFPNEYLEYYPQNAFTRQIGYISDFYDKRDRNIDRDFPYLAKEEMDDFINDATYNIVTDFKEKGIGER